MSLRTASWKGTLILLMLAGACDDDDPPADVEGSYTIAITNGDNPCGFANWDEGDSAMGILLTVSQDGGAIMAMVEGVAGGVVGLLIGSADYEGHVEGDMLVLENFGTRSFTSGDCAFTIKSTALAEISGDTITGTIEYTPVTNGSPACEEIERCVSEQLFNGTRPPTR